MVTWVPKRVVALGRIDQDRLAATATLYATNLILPHVCVVMVPNGWAITVYTKRMARQVNSDHPCISKNARDVSLRDRPWRGPTHLKSFGSL